VLGAHPLELDRDPGRGLTRHGHDPASHASAVRKHEIAEIELLVRFDSDRRARQRRLLVGDRRQLVRARREPPTWNVPSSAPFVLRR
jgi:hypothetical protein